MILTLSVSNVKHHPAQAYRAELPGHSTVTVTMRYTHTNLDSKHAAVAKLEGFELIGEVNSNGKQWRISGAEAIDHIERNKYEFFAEIPQGKRVFLKMSETPKFVST
jgi:hypothetical protein